jgi:acylglycerol lipase
MSTSRQAPSGQGISSLVRHFTASDGYRIAFRHWTAAQPRGIVIPLHGIQSHSGWYEYSSQRMCDAGYSVYFADRRGSGVNGFRRGHAPHAMRLINDVRVLIQLASVESAGDSGQPLPVTLMGISWGGKIAAALAGLFPNELQTLALLYPGLEPRIRPTWWQRRKLRFAETFEVLRTDIPVPLKSSRLFTGQPEWQKFIEEDPLALHSVTSDFLNSGLQLDRLLKAHAHKARHPTLLMLAGSDEVIDNAKTRTRINSLGSRHQTTLVYEPARHTLEFEPNRDRIFSDLIQWLDQHVSAESP